MRQDRPLDGLAPGQFRDLVGTGENLRGDRRCRQLYDDEHDPRHAALVAGMKKPLESSWRAAAPPK